LFEGGQRLSAAQAAIFVPFALPRLHFREEELKTLESLKIEGHRDANSRKVISSHLKVWEKGDIYFRGVQDMVN
jgi:hypothetical protein